MPSNDRQKNAVNRLREIAPESGKIESKISAKIRFVDCGGNFQRISCPSCGGEIPIDWWREQMDKDCDDSGFRLNKLELLCCAAEHNLHELRYDGNEGFGKFSLEAMNPNLGKLRKQQVREFEAILDCPLRVIYRHI